MEKLKKIGIFILGLLLGTPLIAMAINITVPSSPGAGFMLVSTSTGAYISTTTNPIHGGYFWATTTTASFLPFASTTQVSAASLCLTGDTCRTTWPTSGSSAWPWNVLTTYSTSTNATTTPSWFQTALYASSTTAFPSIIDVLKSSNATSTLFTSTTAWIGTLNLTNALTVANGGTGASTLTGCLTGNGTGAITGSGTCNTSNATVSSIATTYPITGGTITTSGTIALAFGTTTANAWSGLNSFSNTGTTTFSGGFEATNVGAQYFWATSSTKVSTFPNASTTNLTINGNVTTGFRYVTFGNATSTAWTASTTISVIAPFSGTLKDVQCSVPTGTLNVQFLVGSTNVSPMIAASSTVGQTTFTANNTFSTGNLIKMTAGTPASSPTEMTCTARATGA